MAADISNEIKVIEQASRGEEVRDAIIDAFNKLNFEDTTYSAQIDGNNLVLTPSKGDPITVDLSGAGKSYTFSLNGNKLVATPSSGDSQEIDLPSSIIYTLSLSGSALTLTPSIGEKQVIDLSAIFPEDTQYSFELDGQTLKATDTNGNEQDIDLSTMGVNTTYTFELSGSALKVTASDGTYQIVDLSVLSNGSSSAEGHTYTISITDDVLYLTDENGSKQSVSLKDYKTNSSGYKYGFNFWNNALSITSTDPDNPNKSLDLSSLNNKFNVELTGNLLRFIPLYDGNKEQDVDLSSLNTKYQIAINRKELLLIPSDGTETQKVDLSSLIPGSADGKLSYIEFDYDTASGVMTGASSSGNSIEEIFECCTNSLSDKNAKIVIYKEVDSELGNKVTVQLYLSDYTNERYTFVNREYDRSYIQIDLFKDHIDRYVLPALGYSIKLDGNKLIFTPPDGTNAEEVDLSSIKTEDSNTTYKINLSGNTLIFTPSDGTKVQKIDLSTLKTEDSNTTYTISLNNNKLIFTPSEGDPQVIDLSKIAGQAKIPAITFSYESSTDELSSSIINSKETDLISLIKSSVLAKTPIEIYYTETDKKLDNTVKLKLYLADYTDTEWYFTSSDYDDTNVTILVKSDGSLERITKDAEVDKDYVELVTKRNQDLSKTNLRSLDWNGNEILTGKLTLGKDPEQDMDAVTLQYFKDKMNYFEDYISKLRKRVSVLEQNAGLVSPSTIDEDGVITQSQATIDENGIVTYPSASIDENGIITI